MEDENTVIVGNKPFKAYKRYVLGLISSGQLEKIKIMARGSKNIYKALSLVEVIKRNNPNSWSNITTKTEELDYEGVKKMVTAVEITFNDEQLK